MRSADRSPLTAEVASELRDALGRRQKELPARWLAALDASDAARRCQVRLLGHEHESTERELGLAVLRDKLADARPRGVVCVQPSASSANLHARGRAVRTRLGHCRSPPRSWTRRSRSRCSSESPARHLRVVCRHRVRLHARPSTPRQLPATARLPVPRQRARQHDSRRRSAAAARPPHDHEPERQHRARARRTRTQADSVAALRTTSLDAAACATFGALESAQLDRRAPRSICRVSSSADLRRREQPPRDASRRATSRSTWRCPGVCAIRFQKGRVDSNVGELHVRPQPRCRDDGRRRVGAPRVDDGRDGRLRRRRSRHRRSDDASDALVGTLSAPCGITARRILVAGLRHAVPCTTCLTSRTI